MQGVNQSEKLLGSPDSAFKFVNPTGVERISIPRNPFTRLQFAYRIDFPDKPHFYYCTLTKQDWPQSAASCLHDVDCEGAAAGRRSQLVLYLAFQLFGLFHPACDHGEHRHLADKFLGSVDFLHLCQQILGYTFG